MWCGSDAAAGPAQTARRSAAGGARFFIQVQRTGAIDPPARAARSHGWRPQHPGVTTRTSSGRSFGVEVEKQHHQLLKKTRQQHRRQPLRRHRNQQVTVRPPAEQR